MTTTRKHNRIARPQVEATVSLSITAKLMKFTARQDFVVGNCQVKKGETCFAVRSERREGRYYIVRFNTDRNQYQCSCGANCCEHEHLKVVREYVVKNVVIPAKSVGAKQDDKSTKQAVATDQTQVIDPTVPLTAAEWKAIYKRDKARQKAWADEYRQAAAALAG